MSAIETRSTSRRKYDLVKKIFLRGKRDQLSEDISLLLDYVLGIKSIDTNKNNMNILDLPYEVIMKIIKSYWDILPKCKVLRDWIDVNKLDWYKLSENKNAIDLLKENKDKIDWEELSSNPSIFVEEKIKE